MTAALETLSTGHVTLTEGWKAGESHGAATLKEIAVFAHDVVVEIRAFKNPAKGDAQ
jgi:hypothetical protein